MEYDKVAALAQTDLFKDLNRRTLRHLADVTVILNHAPGTVITDEGEQGISFHLILEGTASVSVGSSNRPDLGPGDYFGEIAVLDGKPRTATVTAKTELVTASIGIWNLKPLFLKEPGVLWALTQELCARLRSIEAAEGAGAV